MVGAVDGLLRTGARVSVHSAMNALIQLWMDNGGSTLYDGSPRN